MAGEFGIRLNGLAEVQQSLANIPDEMFPTVKAAFRRATLSAHAAVSSRLSGGPMESRTGLLRRSLQTEVKGTSLNSLRASFYSGPVLGTPVVYARVHEYGATIKAKRAYRNVPGGPYLNIPGRDNLTAAGVMRKTARQVFEEGGFIAKFRDRLKYGVFLDGNLMFILQKEVEIPARLGMRDAGNDVIPGLLDDLRAMNL